MAPTAEERRLRMLNAKKEALFGIMQTLFDLTRSLTDDQARAKFKNLFGSLQKVRDDFSEIFDEVVALNLELNEKYVPDYEVLGTVAEMCGQIERAAKKLNDIEVSEKIKTEDSRVKKQSAPKLPKIELPSFSGDIRHWESFYGVFKSLIHDNLTLTNEDKIYYLAGCIRGPARSVFSGMTLSGKNYELLWKDLVERYQDKRALANAYLNQILDYKDFRTESEKGLILFLENFDAPVRALKNLELDDLTGFILVYLAMLKLNPDSVHYFEVNRQSADVPRYDELIEFIKLRVKTLSAKGKSVVKVKETEFSKPRVSKSFVISKETTKCGFCQLPGHACHACEGFKAQTPEVRYTKVRELNLCFNCLSAAHGVRNCPSTKGCDKCGKRHHSLLHEGREAAGLGKNRQEKGVPTLHSTWESGGRDGCSVLLGTARVTILGPFGEGSGRFLLDNGSQTNLVTLRCCKQLGIELARGPSVVQGLGGTSQPVRGIAQFVIQSKVSPYKSYQIKCLVVDRITGRLPQGEVKLKDTRWLNNIPLADSNFGKPDFIDGIIGAELFAEIIGPKRVQGEQGGPSAIETELGYVIMGKVPLSSKIENLGTYITVCEEPSLTEIVKNFWELEEVPKVTNTQIDEECEELFVKTCQRDESGRFTVALPFKNPATVLGNSSEMARRRFLALESRLEKRPDIKTEYHKAFKDFVDQGHVYPVREKYGETPSYCIPHHAVFKTDSTSTPVRIVLDASAPSDNGLSLNSIVHCGPKLQIDIVGLLIRFRLFAVAITADIKQMYRQIMVVEPHRRFQRLFWRWSKNDPLQLWEMKTLAFGVKSSPYLALRCVKKLLEDEGSLYPETKKLIENNLYMDDLVLSVPREEDAQILYRESVELFWKGKFELKKWASNSKRFLSSVPVEKRLQGDVTFKTETRILGLIWNAADDELRINFPTPELKCTKRTILSSVARCFDPIGVVAPLTLGLKVLMKELWSCKLGWDDEEVPESIQKRWRRVITEWPVLKNLVLKRGFQIVPGTPVKILGFADASQDGYGAVIYLKVKRKTDFAISFVCAKSRVSPIKSLSIPRLELCAALLLSNLINYLLEAIQNIIIIDEIWAFSDSSTVLQWIHSVKITDSFVVNRVSKIRENVPAANWRHIAGKDNPADGLSRGLTPRQLTENKLWIKGPAWAENAEESWPCSSFEQILESNEPAVEVFTATTKVTETAEKPHPLLQLIEEKSSWSQILRITVWVLRFGKKVPKGSTVSVGDLQAAEMMLVKLVQAKHFREDLDQLKKDRQPSNRLKKLRPFLHQGVMRVGGRLALANLPFEQRHPAILPKNDIMTERLIDYYHLKYLHAGAYLVESFLRLKFWIVNGHSLIKKRVRLCNRCFKLNPKAVQPVMGNLPEPRVTPGKAFLKSGVDYFGPINITLGRRRGAAVHKAYVALFICLAVKAVHLELVSSLDTEHFLQAFRRFLSRRGPCNTLYSDRGTNFVGAKRFLSDLQKLTISKEHNDAIRRELAENEVEWNFNPAGAPHMGGIWESHVKLVKRHIQRVIGEQILTYEEFNTLLIQIEALLNSRPLCVQSVDALAPTALTPAHFINLSPLKTFHAEDVSDVKVGLLSRFQLIDKMVQDFWKRWHLEYLTTLQVRRKWSQESDNLTEGTVVVLKQENNPPLRWPLGIVTGVFPGKDGVVRTVKVKCGLREYIRPVVKVYPLPTQ